MNTVPYIRDPQSPRCLACGAHIYVQADSTDRIVKIGKEEKKVKDYKVRQDVNILYPDIMTACRCKWLLKAVGAARTQRAAAA